MDILKRVQGLPVAPVSPGTDEQNRILGEYLPFRVLEYESGREHNGWIVPQNWEVKKAEIRKDGELVYDGRAYPLGVIGSSECFQGRVSLEELKKHLFFREQRPNDIVYHCDLYYKPFLKQWGFCMPFALYQKLEDGEYEVELVTTHEPGTMKVLEYTHEGASRETIILNAHNCHAAQLNDGPSGYAVFTAVMNRLQGRSTKYTYRLIVAPEHIGTVFYLADLPESEIANFRLGIFLEMVGLKSQKFALQESFAGKSLIDKIAHHVLRHRSRSGYWSDQFRKIVGNDETVWEAPGIEVPMISLSRCEGEGSCFSEYHTSADNLSLMNKESLEETAEIIMSMIDVLEQDAFLTRKFKGLVALSNPKYELYMRPGTDPSIKDALSADQPKWNYLMDCLPRYFDGKHSILDIAVKHDLPFDQVYGYISKFRDKNLVEFVDPGLRRHFTTENGSQKFFGQRIYLRKLGAADATEEYAGWLNDPDANNFLETRKTTLPELRDYIKQQNDNRASALLGVFDRENDVHIGNVKLEPIDWEKKRAVFGILIGNKQYWRQGIGTEATKLAVEYAFRILGLEEVELGVIPENLRARRTFERAGFKYVTTIPKVLNHDGVLYDKIVMAVKKENEYGT